MAGMLWRSYCAEDVKQRRSGHTMPVASATAARRGATIVQSETILGDAVRPGKETAREKCACLQCKAVVCPPPLQPPMGHLGRLDAIGASL
jgi:hypothetical protein